MLFSQSSFQIAAAAFIHCKIPSVTDVVIALALNGVNQSMAVATHSLAFSGSRSIDHQSGDAVVGLFQLVQRAAA